MKIWTKVTGLGLIALSAGMMFLPSCGSDDATDIGETAQQVGDVMASIDESGGNSGSLASLQIGTERSFARLAPKEIRDGGLLDWISPNAYAACGTSTFSSCSSNVITRTFGGCTVGGATFTGTVTLTFSDLASDSTCQMTTSGHSITRVPNFTVTGRRGSTLTVSKSGSVGQVITKGSGSSFSFTNDGIRRAFTNSGGTTTFDFTTQTTSAITVTGTSRANRTLSGGALRVTNNLDGSTCDFVPSGVTWASGCNCPTSGSWSATCSDGKAATVSITGCGTATFTLGDESEDVTFDRCTSTI